MGILTISQTLQTASLEKDSAEVIAKVIEQKNQALATKQDLELLATVLIGDFCINTNNHHSFQSPLEGENATFHSFDYFNKTSFNPAKAVFVKRLTQQNLTYY